MRLFGFAGMILKTAATATSSEQRGNVRAVTFCFIDLCESKAETY